MPEDAIDIEAKIQEMGLVLPDPLPANLPFPWVRVRGTGWRGKLRGRRFHDDRFTAPCSWGHGNSLAIFQNGDAEPGYIPLKHLMKKYKQRIPPGTTPEKLRSRLRRALDHDAYNEAVK